MGRLVAFGVVLMLLVLLGVTLMKDTVLKPEHCLVHVRRAEEGRFAAVVSQERETVFIEYDDKTQVRVPRAPRRIVSTLPGITEMIAYLGAEQRLIAVSPHCDYPPSVARLRTVTVMPLDVEALIELRPDLVILDRGLHRAAIAEARSHLGNVLLLDTSRSLGHLRTSFDLLARVLDDDEARKQSREWVRALEAIKVELAGRRVLPTPRVLIVAQWEPLYVMGPDAMLDDLMRACGCINIACDLKSRDSGPFSEELVLERKPDWILLPHAEMPDHLRERWAHVPAVAHERYLDAWTDDVVRGGPRILDGLAALADELLGPR